MRTAFINGNVITADQEFRTAEAFLMEEERFLSVGTNEEVMEAAGVKQRQGGPGNGARDGLTVVDLKGRTVLPGFNDSHLHLLNYAYGLSKFDCGQASSIGEMIEMCREYIRKKQIPEGSWVSGRGWNQVFLKENRLPRREELDQISTAHPIVFTRVCEHMVAVNSKALKLAGITEQTENPEGGEIERDGDGRLTGMLKETARYLIYRIIPPKTVEEIKDMLEEAIRTASAFGVTSAQTDDFETFSDKDWRKVIRAYRELIQEGRMNIRVYEQCLLPQIDRLKEFLDEGNVTGKGDEYFKIGPLKLLTDGSLGGRTAYLSRPYHDAPDRRGIPVFTREELDELIVTAHTRGMQLVCHGIGDAAMNRILDSFEKAQEALPKEDARAGIIHVQITDLPLIRRFKEQKVLAYLEPVCLNSDLHIVEERVGKELSKTSYNYRTFCDMGIRTPMSSDCPVDSLNPFDSMYVGVNRVDYSGFPEGGFMPEQKLTVEQMIKGFTIDGAYASFEEREKGSIEPGKYADFIIVSGDPLKTPPLKLREIKVEETYLAGRRIFKR